MSLARVNMLVTREAQTKIEPWLSTDLHVANSLPSRAQVFAFPERVPVISTGMVWPAKTGRPQFVQHTSGKFSPLRKTKQARGYAPTSLLVLTCFGVAVGTALFRVLQFEL